MDITHEESQRSMERAQKMDVTQGFRLGPVSLLKGATLQGLRRKEVGGRVVRELRRVDTRGKEGSGHYI